MASIGEVEKIDILDFDHVEFVVSGVKISFYANPNFSPLQKEIECLNNIKLADLKSIGAMKMEVMLRRSKFRDYYDIYSLIVSGEKLSEMVDIALRYSSHKLKSKNLLSMLSRGERFVKDSSFATLNPIYDVTAQDIEARIREEIEKQL